MRSTGPVERNSVFGKLGEVVTHRLGTDWKDVENLEHKQPVQHIVDAVVMPLLDTIVPPKSDASHGRPKAVATLRTLGGMGVDMLTDWLVDVAAGRHTGLDVIYTV